MASSASKSAGLGNSQTPLTIATQTGKVLPIPPIPSSTTPVTLSTYSKSSIPMASRTSSKLPLITRQSANYESEDDMDLNDISDDEDLEDQDIATLRDTAQAYLEDMDRNELIQFIEGQDNYDEEEHDLDSYDDETLKDVANNYLDQIERKPLIAWIRLYEDTHANFD